MSGIGRRRGRIRNELVLGLAAVILISSLSSYVVILLAFRRDFDTLVEKNDLEIAKTYAVSLGKYYSSAGSWDGLADELAILRSEPAARPESEQGPHPDRRHPKDSDIPLILTDADGIPLYNGMRVKDGDRPLKLPSKLKTADGQKVEVDGRTVGYIFFKTMVFKTYNPQEEAFISALTRSIGFSVAIGLVLALGLGTVLASRFARPVTALDTAVTTIAGGDLSARVEVGRRDEIGSLAVNFNRMADKLQATETARQNLLADIAHELRTPVSIIQANLEMLIDGVYVPDAARLRSLHEETRILTDLISDLRSLSDLEVGIVKVRTERVRLAALVDESCRKFRPLFEEKGIALGTDLGAGDAEVMAEDDQLRQVIRNVLGNALKYAPEGSAVSVRLENGQDRDDGKRTFRLTIGDEGVGVPEGETERIFDRFYRVDPSRNRESGGRGLGLAISRKIVEAFGGRIGAYNRAPHGLALWIELPSA